MDTNWAADHLQTIRTLMERSALYRRALAPISTFVGVVGIVAGGIGWKANISEKFPIYWLGVALVAVIGALLLVRRQAVQQGENFWSPPTRRVVQAMSPALLVGFVFGALSIFVRWPQDNFLVVFWALLYGLSLHAAGFFMPRGIRLFGWAIIGCGLLMQVALIVDWFSSLGNHFENIAMGIIFGASHLAYGVYLYFTERKNEA